MYIVYTETQLIHLPELSGKTHIIDANFNRDERKGGKCIASEVENHVREPCEIYMYMFERQEFCSGKRFVCVAS